MSAMNEAAIKQVALSLGISEPELSNALFWLRANDNERRKDFRGGPEVVVMLLSALSAQNDFEKACREWMRGCSCAPDGEPWRCEECTRGFHDRIKGLVSG